MLMQDSEIKFVAKYYRRGAFSAKDGWRRMGIASFASRRLGIVASISALVVLAAAALAVYRAHSFGNEAIYEDVTVVGENVDAEICRTIEFTDASLDVVVAEIEGVYGVDIEIVPDDAADIRLTLRYDGSAAGLIGIINEIEGTAMSVAEE